MIYRPIVPLVMLAAVAALAVAEEPPATDPDRAGIEYFERHVRPLLAEHCYECHSAERNVTESELALDHAAGIRRGGSRGPAVVAGKPDDSLLVAALRYTDDLQMPPRGRLVDDQIAVLAEWVRRGAPLPPETAPASAPKAVNWEAARRYWAFQPLAVVPMPGVKNHGWAAGKIDAFVLARLEQQQLAPNPPADPKTLIRRVSLDLLGLPPAPDEVEAFCADSAPHAFERLLDRLLASPHYGERWGRFWLDLARYADVTPTWLNSTERAWLYRDWVIRALNDDLPYDRFGQLQLAADLLPDEASGDLAALGFLGISPTRWKELRLAPVLIETVVAEEWDERLDAVTRTFLGLNVTCARCHDHKYDPVTMEDYYALAGVFASSQLADRPLLPEPEAQAVRAARQEVEKLQKELQAIQDGQSPAAAQLRQRIETLQQSTPHYHEPWAHVVEESSVHVHPDGPDATRLEYRAGEPRDLRVFLRGNPANQGEVVARRFLRVLSAEPLRPFQHGSGRRELAAAIFDEAAPLTARVLVNRVWRHHFGHGLVRTPSDFGSQGERPSHPELLDDLATRFVEHGWSLKWLHREILMSATYRQSSAYRDDAFAVDPENRLLWRMHRRRLDVDAWRDAILCVTGSLDRRLYGPGADLADPAHRRRTIYGHVARHGMNDLLRLYDYPDPESHSPKREETTTPLQQLFVLNSPFMLGQADALANRLLSAPVMPEAAFERRIELVYRWLFERDPTPAELDAARRFWNSRDSATGDERQRWARYVHVLLGLNEFMFVD